MSGMVGVKLARLLIAVILTHGCYGEYASGGNFEGTLPPASNTPEGKVSTLSRIGVS